MKPSLILDSDEDDFGDYQQELKERVNRSIQQLSRIPDEQYSEAQSMVMEPANSDHGDTRNRVQPSDAVNQLRAFLQEQNGSAASSPAKKRSLRKSSSPGSDAGLPTAQDLVPMIHNQAEYIQHLEAEVKFCKEELLGMKQRIRVVIVENEKLHKELRSYTAEETLKDYTILDATNGPGDEPVAGSHPRSSPFKQCHSHVEVEDHTWQTEMEKLKTLYQAQTETLEAQVISLRKDLAVSQKECEEAKGRLRTREAAGSSSRAQQAGGMCLKCAQQEAVLTHTHTNVHIQAIERLTRERDELAGMLASQRASQSDAQHREWSSYQQVKQAVQMAEEANLEKTEALVQCQQIRSELIRQRERLERELMAELEKISQVKEEVRGEARKEKEELAKMVTELSQTVAELQGQRDRCERESRSLQAQLEEALRKLSTQEAESNKVCGELRFQLSHAQLKKQEAERELRDHTSKSSRQLDLTQQEVEKLGLELIGCQQRLDEAQQDGGRAQAEVLSLTERLCHAQHQLHLTRQEKEATERARSADTDALTFQAQQREQELRRRLQQAEAQHERSVSDMDTLLSSQNSLITKLKEECCSLGLQLEQLTESSRAELERLCLEKAQLQENVRKLREQCEKMEEQCAQHGALHQRMQRRLQKLDAHCQASAQQVMQLLSRQNQLMQERHILSEEMHTRLTQATATGRPEPSS